MKRVTMPLLALLLGSGAAAQQAQHASAAHAGGPGSAPALAKDAPPAAASATAPAATTAPPGDSAKAKAAPSAAPKAATMVVGTGTVKFSGLLQAWYTAGNQGLGNTFRVRRAELRFVGELSPRVKWTIAADVAKAITLSTTYGSVSGSKVVTDGSVTAPTNPLQDAYVSLLWRGLTLDAGQMKLPLSAEGTQSLSTIETVEKALFLSDRGRSGSYGDVRDVGAVLRAPTKLGVDFNAGVFNGPGDGQNSTDKNAQKAVVGRVIVRRLPAGLRLGASGVWSGPVTTASPRRNRAGVDATWSGGPAMVRVEAMGGLDGAVRRRGGYVLAVYRLRPADLVTRVDTWDPDVHAEADAATARETDLLLGFNRALGPTSRLQVNGVRRRLGAGLPARNQLLTDLQVSW